MPVSTTSVRFGGTSTKSDSINNLDDVRFGASSSKSDALLTEPTEQGQKRMQTSVQQSDSPTTIMDTHAKGSAV